MNEAAASAYGHHTDQSATFLQVRCFRSALTATDGVTECAGQALGRVFHDHYQSYGLLMDSFEAKAANVVKKAS